MPKIVNSFAHLHKTNPKEYYKLATKKYRTDNPEKFIVKDKWRKLDKNLFNELPTDVVPIDNFLTYYARPNGEVWRDTRGTLSAIKTGKERVLRLTPTYNAYNGYWLIQPYKDGKKKAIHLHRFILEAFKGPPPAPKMECHHIDHDTSNNSADNLMWVTRQENCDFVPRHHRTVTKKTLETGRKVSKTKHSHLYPQVLELYNLGNGVTKIAKFLNLNVGVTEQIVKKFIRSGQLTRIKRKHAGQINQYDLEGNFIKTWNNAKDAAEHMSGKRSGGSMITGNCNYKSKTALGFVWRWI